MAVSQIGGRLFGTTVGSFWAGFKVGTLPNGDTVLRSARIVKIGTVGMPDLIGFMPHVVTQDDVGKTLAVFCAPEVKAGTDSLSKEQRAFIEFVNKNGGRAGVARSREDAVRIVTAAPDQPEPK